MFKLSRRLLLWLALIALVLVGCAPSAPAKPTPTPNGVTVLDAPVKIADFTLTDQTGQSRNLSSLKGKYNLMAFGYTHCPDICPVTLAHFKAVKRLLGEHNQHINIVFVSVDGARDTPARLAEYLKIFDPDFIGLTGDEASVRALIKQYKGDFKLNNEGGKKENYDVDHTANWFLMDGAGQWRHTYAYNTEPEVMAADIQAVLKTG